MPHCIAFESSIQAKNRKKDPKIRFHKFPDDAAIRRLWIHAVGRMSFLTGRIFRFKLIRQNGPEWTSFYNHDTEFVYKKMTRTYADNLDEQPSYAITLESLARRSKWRSREVRTCLKGLSWEAKKKNLKRENIFLCEKSVFGDLKSILGDIFLKSGGSL